MANIHSQAIVEEGAVIGDNVTIEPFAVVKSGVNLGDNVVIKSHAYIDGNTTIGEGTVIFPSVSIGTKPQHLQFTGEGTHVYIGKGCEIREFVTINSSCEPGSEVRVGDKCLIMAYSHIAHDCRVGSHVIMANNATLAGHVEVGDHAIIGGMTPLHQFVRVGRYAMVGGMSRIPQDIPPYTIGGGIPYKMGGINLVGLKRNGFDLKQRQLLSRTFRLMYRSGLKFHAALDAIEEQIELIPEVQHWLDFCRATKRGVISVQGVMSGKNAEEPALAQV